MAALLDLYPDIGLEEHKFNTSIYLSLLTKRKFTKIFKGKTHKYWNDAANRRKVFDRIAQENGFDPLIPENWYSISRNFIISQKVIRSFNCCFIFI